MKSISKPIRVLFSVCISQVSGCHSGSSAPLGLMLDEGLAYDNLVGVISGQDSDFQRVNPGNANDSYLIQKLEGTASGGVQMPIGQPPLSLALIQNVRDWIDAGALLAEASDSSVPAATLSEIQNSLFTPRCIECHGGNFPAAGLSLDNGQSFTNLVNVTSVSGTNTRVVPGNSSTSFLVRKLSGTDLMPGEGGRMPLGRDRVDQILIDQVASWVDAGAMNN